jgi:hypothetical protein
VFTFTRPNQEQLQKMQRTVGAVYFCISGPVVNNIGSKISRDIATGGVNPTTVLKFKYKFWHFQVKFA